MRKILFRGKRLSDGVWTEGDLSRCVVVGETHIRRIEGNLSTTTHRVDPKTVCQYTGMTDRNGRKIFEGDIVRYTDEVTGKERADEVEYNETHAAFCRLHKGEMGLQYLFIDESIADRCEVTGNVYDNPTPADET